MLSSYKYLRNSLSKLFSSPIDYEFLEYTDTEKVKRRLAKGYDINQPITDWKFHDHETIRPIHFACARSTPQVVGYLLDYGAKVDDTTDSGLQPIHFAVIYKKIHIIDELMNSSADANVQDNRGYTPLHYAVETKNLGAVKKLLKSHGADPYIKNEQLNDAFTMAKQLSFYYIVEYLQNWEADKQSNQKIQNVLSAQDELSKDVKNVEQKVENMQSQIKREIRDELRSDIHSLARLEITRQMCINNHFSIYGDSGYSSRMSLTEKASVNGNVPSLIMQYENMSMNKYQRNINHMVARGNRPEIQWTGDSDESTYSNVASTEGDSKTADQKEMEDIRMVVRRNFIFLSSNIKAKPIINYLFQEEVIGPEEREYLNESLKTNSARCEYLINEILWKGSPRDFRVFLKGLEEIGQPHIAEKIRNTDLNSMYSRRTPGTLYNVPLSAAQSAPLFTNLTKLWKSGDINL